MLLTIVASLTVALIHFTLPQKPLPGDLLAKTKQMDWIGTILSLTMSVCILVRRLKHDNDLITQVPLSGGGSTFPWSSSTVIALLVVGGLAAVAFIWVEGWVATLPLFPGRL